MAELSVEICSHFFRVSAMTVRGRPVVVEFARKNVQWGMERVPRPGQAAGYKWAPMRVFAAATKDYSEYRFHIHQLKLFREALERDSLRGDAVSFTTRPMYEPAKAQFVVRPEWNDREDQIPVIEYLSNPELPVQRLVELQTGKGKSFCAMRAAQILGTRAVFMVRPMYIDKWVEDIMRTYDIAVEDVMVVKGGAHLMALIDLAAAGALASKIVLISNKTMQNWLKLYEHMKDGVTSLGYGCVPDQLMETLQAGVRIINEVHQDFHLNFKIDLHTHVPNSMSLSATLLSDDDFLNKMYEIAYPSSQRYKANAYHRYVEARALTWHLRHPYKVRTKEFGSNTYSHHAFEKSIMRDKSPDGMLKNYLDMIARIVKLGHLRESYKPGDRCLVYCAGIDMCTLVVAELRKRFPHLVINRYVEEDPYENLMQSDISVSTLLSAGTAVDVPRLTTVILTTAVSSSPSNLQGFGRLRELKDGTVPQFYYTVCEDIPKHVEYHERKRALLETRALNYKSFPILGAV